MIPWEMGRQMVWNVTVVDALAPSRLNECSSCNPATTATEAKARTSEKYCKLLDIGYNFQLIASKVHCSLGESNEIFIKRL